MEWQSFLIKDFGGIASSNRNPQINQAHEMVNFDTRDRYGDIITRKAHANLYSGIASADHRSKLSSVTYLKATSFIAETDDGTKQEVSVIISKGTVAADYSTSAAAASIKTVQIWTSHRWSGTAWVRKNWDKSTEGWFWLNHVIVTTAAVISGHEVTLDVPNNAALLTELPGWVIYNVTKGEYADILKAENDGGLIKTYISYYNNAWDFGTDTLVLMRNYYPYDFLTAMGHSSTGITATDVQFHTINNSLRVGFGGKANRQAVVIAYANRYLGLYSLDAAYTGILSADLDTFNHRNDLFCEPISYKADDAVFSITTDLDFTPTDGLPGGTYYMYLVGLVDGFERIILAKGKQVLNYSLSALAIIPNIQSGKLLSRIRSLEFYVSYDSSITSIAEIDNYYLYKVADFIKAGSTVFNLALLANGTYSYKFSTTEVYTTSNAILTGTDANSVTGITAGVSTAISAVTPGYNGSAYKCRIPYVDGVDSSVFTVTIDQPAGLFATGKKYTISFDINVTYSDVNVISLTFADFKGGSINRSFTFEGVSDLPQSVRLDNVEVNSAKTAFTFEVYLSNGEDVQVHIDNLSIKEFSAVIHNSTKTTAEFNKIEITNRLGYEPTTDLALSWDKAIVAGGRAYLANPVFKDGRQNNRVFFSVFSGVGASQYDIIPFNFLNSFDLELFDGNNLVSLELLPNGNFLALRKNSAQIIDSGTGASRQILYGKGCVSIDSVINSGTEVIWASQGDIILTDGLNDANITENTIRNDYREIQNTANIFATREIKDNAYRFYSTDADGEPQEYLISKRGWLKFTRFFKSDPISIYGYYTAADGTIIMLTNQGVLLKDQNSAIESESIEFNWLSVPFDLTLMGSASQGNMYVKAIAVKCTAARNMNLIAKIYVNGTLYDTQTIALVSTSGDHTKIVRIKLGCSARTIQLGLSGTDTTGNSLIISAVGIQYKVIRGDQLG